MDQLVHRTRPTLEVVAARAGVSRATASRVLRGSPNVSEDARAAVLRVADEMSYTPNRAARSLVTRRSDSIAFLVAESEDRLFSDPFFLSMLRGAQAEIASADLQLVFAIVSSLDEIRQFEHYASGGHVDGVLLLSLHGDDSLPLQLESMGVPTVLSGRPFNATDTLCYVNSDNLGGATAATNLLIERGSQRIATVTGPLDMTVAQDRLAGYRSALEAAGRRPLKRLIAVGDFTAAGAERATQKLLAEVKDVDAIFAASDLSAIGAIRAIQASGRKVPADIAVVGFDDVREASLSSPLLTTVRQPIHEMGRHMAHMLLRRIEGHLEHRVEILPVEVVRRESA